MCHHCPLLCVFIMWLVMFIFWLLYISCWSWRTREAEFLSKNEQFSWFLQSFFPLPIIMEYAYCPSIWEAEVGGSVDPKSVWSSLATYQESLNKQTRFLLSTLSQHQLWVPWIWDCSGTSATLCLYSTLRGTSLKGVSPYLSLHSEANTLLFICCLAITYD